MEIYIEQLYNRRLLERSLIFLAGLCHIVKLGNIYRSSYDTAGILSTQLLVGLCVRCLLHPFRLWHMSLQGF